MSTGAGDSTRSRREFLRDAGLTAGAVAATGAVQTGSAAAATRRHARGSRFPARPYGAHNVEAVGYTDLGGRNEAFKLAIQEVEGRWLLYTGHFWNHGWSIIDVTEPHDPRYLNFVAWPKLADTNQMEVADGKMIVSLDKLHGQPGEQQNDEGCLIFDLTADPVNPRLLGQFHTGGVGCHRNFYAGGRYMHLTANMAGYEGYIYVIVDIADPAHPVEVSRYWVPGQWVAGGEQPQPGASLHGPAYVDGDVVWCPWGTAGIVVLDISDVAHPKRIGGLGFDPPFSGGIPSHTVVPLGNGYAAACGEATQEYPAWEEPPTFGGIVNISDPANPWLYSQFPVPTPPRRFPDEYFADHGGRFGPHNLNTHYHSRYVQSSPNLQYLAYFVGGLRVYDISDPRQPREVGFFVPPDPQSRIGPIPKGRLVLQSYDTLTDARGYTYVSDPNQGIWIVRYTGPQPAA